ncbi:hypothetical protein O988_07011 [Pseudogymnoascus sp. VKM F-3808]|nr:hypothetical protein O988_07011 [Pseudogymnoascus sp. VKM F-3808]
MLETLDSGGLRSSEIIDPQSTSSASTADLEKSSDITPDSIQTISSNAETTASLRARSRVDLSVLPLLFLGLFVFQLDRMNLASALTAGLKADIKITQADVNLGNQMMFLGIVVLEIPSNMLLQRIGPRIYISIQVIIFGLIATLQIFVRDRNGFLIIRSFLGLAEAGYIPGAIYTLSTWYRHKELATRVAIFFFGMFGGNALSPLLASGILKLGGRYGRPGWQWIFLLEGIFTISVGLLIGFLLPGSPERPRPLFFQGLVRISESDGVILQQRIAADLPNKSYEPQHMRITPAKVWKTISHWRRWPHLISTSLVFSTWSSLTTYTPTIIMSLGFDRTSANALACIGPVIALFIVFLFARLSDYTNRRGFMVIIAISCYITTLIIARATQPHVGKWSRWGLWTAVNAFAVGYHPVQNTWLQLNCHDPAERSISIALWVMSAISGLMYGTQYFQEKDLPLYSRGLEIMIGVSVAGLVLAGVQILIYTAYDRKTEELKKSGLIVEGESRINAYRIGNRLHYVCCGVHLNERLDSLSIPFSGKYKGRRVDASLHLWKSRRGITTSQCNETHFAHNHGISPQAIAIFQMLSIRAEMRTAIRDFLPNEDNPLQSWLHWRNLLNVALGAIKVIIYVLLCITYYVLCYIWPWSYYNKKARARKRKEHLFQQLVHKAACNTTSIALHQVQDQGILGKDENYLLHHLPFEVRRKILVYAFGEQTVHMDLQFRYPFEAPVKQREWGRHAGIDYYSERMDQEDIKGERKEWRWFSCVCHRLPPDAPQLPLGRRRHYLRTRTNMGDPDTDLCLHGFGQCDKWPGDCPAKCLIGIMGWMLSCKQAYLEGVDVLYTTNTIHISSPALIRAMQDVIPWQRFQNIASLEFVMKPNLVPFDVAFTSSRDSAGRRSGKPTFPGLKFLRISFPTPTVNQEDWALGLVWPYADEDIFSRRLHDSLLPEMDRLLERIVPPTTDVTMSCSWEWYSAIDVVLRAKQGKEETRMQRADLGGLKCWRNTPRRVGDLSSRALEDAQGVEGRRKGFWIHVAVEDMHRNNTAYD